MPNSERREAIELGWSEWISLIACLSVQPDLPVNHCLCFHFKGLNVANGNLDRKKLNNYPIEAEKTASLPNQILQEFLSPGS